MRVGPDDGAHATVEEPAHADLLARSLGVHVDKDVVDAPPQVGQDCVDLDEGRAPGAQEEVARERDDAEAHAAAVDDDGAVAGLRAQVVGGPDDPLLLVEVGVDLAAAVGVVAERDDVDAAVEELVGELRRDPEPAGDVLGVDHDEGRRVLRAQSGEQAEQRPPAEAADDVADEEQGRRRFGHAPYSPVRAP